VDPKVKTPKRTGASRLAFHASRIIIDAGVLMAMAAMSMPFVTTDGADRSSVAADALPVVFLLAPIFLITLIPDHSRPLPTPLGWLSLILGVAAFPYAIVKYLDAGTLADTLGGDIGFGARLLIFGTFVTVVGIGVGLARNLLHLPSGGTYSARRPVPAAKATAGKEPRRRVQQQAAPRPRPHQPAEGTPRTTPPDTNPTQPRPRPRQPAEGTPRTTPPDTDPTQPRPRTDTTPPGRTAQPTRPADPEPDSHPGER